jgi:hypothetical protein
MLDGINRVAFVNIANGNIFFDCSPVEARRAKKYIESERLLGRHEVIKESVDYILNYISANDIKTITFDDICKVNDSNCGLTQQALNYYLSNLEMEDCFVEFIVVCPQDYSAIRKYDNIVEFYSTDVINTSGVFCTVWGAEVIVSNKCEKNCLYVISHAQKDSDRLIRKFQICSSEFNEKKELLTNGKIIDIRFGIKE